MKRASRKVWARRVAAWQRSGKTAREYAARIGVNPNTLSHWKWQLGKEAEREPEHQPSLPEQERRSPVTFVEVLPSAAMSPPQAESFEVHLADDKRITVPAHFDPESLRRLLEVLAQAS